MATTTSAVPAAARRSASGRPATFPKLRAAFGRWQEQARIRFELQQMSARELADLGLNPSDIDDVARGTYRRD